MAVSPDIYDIVDVFGITNLSNLTSPTHTFVVPLGLGVIVNTAVFNNLGNVGLKVDIEQVLDVSIVTTPIPPGT